MTAAAERTVAIVGAGFSGAVLATQLLRQPADGPLRVVLVNRSGAMARGLAYGTSSRGHLLNVPAGNMSALAEDADDFLRYCRWVAPATAPQSFVPRRFYGCYLEALLDAAAHGARPGCTLERLVGEVVGIEPQPQRGGAVVRLADGRSIGADHVVLAFGHFPPADPEPVRRALSDSRRYVRDPWAEGALDGIAGDAPVLLLGSGLTAIDVALALADRGQRAPILCLSRRGLLPAPHRAQRKPPDPQWAAALVGRLGRTVRANFRALRAAVREHEAAGGDWRDVIGALRPHTPGWWRDLPAGERQRFLRHLQPYWDVSRHRCAPGPYELFRALVDDGRLSVAAGRVASLRELVDGVEVRWRPRGGGDERRCVVGHVVNCTGPGSDLARVDQRLVRGLMQAGLLRPDDLGIGIAVDAHGALIGADGVASPSLHYLGPLLRARDWEATAVPELRVHALALARRLLGRLPQAAVAGDIEPAAVAP